MRVPGHLVWLVAVGLLASCESAAEVSAGDASDVQPTDALAAVDGTVQTDGSSSADFASAFDLATVVDLATADDLALSLSGSLSTVALNPSQAIADGVDSIEIVVSVRDANGAPRPGVNVGLVLPADGSIVALATAMSDVSGQASFVARSLVAQQTQIEVQLGLPPHAVVLDDHPVLTFVPGAADHLAVSQPLDLQAGDSFELVASIEDAQGNSISSDGVAITAEVSDGPAGGVLDGTVDLTSVDGVTRFSNLRLTRAGSGYRLRVTSPGLGSAETAPFNVSPGVGASLAFSAAPAAATAGVTFSPQPAVVARDEFGNEAPTTTGSVSLSINCDGSGALGLGSAPLLDGQAAFSGLYVTKRAASCVLTASAAFSATAVDSAAFAVSGGPALYVDADPIYGTSNQLVAPVTVKVKDAYGNLTGDGSLLDLQLFRVWPSGVPLGVEGTTTRTIQGGVAQFDDLIFHRAGSFNGAFVLDGSATILGYTYVQIAFEAIDLASSSIAWSPSGDVAADGVQALVVTYTARRADGTPIDDTNAQLIVSGRSNTIVNLNSAGAATGSFELRSTYAEVKHVELWLNGTLLGTRDVPFVPGSPSPSLTAAYAEPSLALADGVAPIRVTMWTRDALYNAVPGVAVTATSDHPEDAWSPPPPIPTTADGRATFELRSTTPGEHVLTLTADGISRPVKVRFVTAPTITDVAMLDDRGCLPIRYRAIQAEALPVDVAVEVESGGAWTSATQAALPGVEGRLQRSTSAVGDLHQFGWNSLADLNRLDGTTRLRLTARVGPVVGPPLVVDAAPIKNGHRWSSLAGGNPAPGVVWSAVGDFDRDSVPDVVASSPGAQELRIWRGDGAGGLVSGPASTLSAAGPTVAADFDRDGKPDVAVAAAQVGQVGIWRGDGALALGVMATVPVSAGGRDLRADDVDRDGDVDLVHLSSDGLGVTVLLNDGAGAFPASTTTLLPAAAASLTLVDLDRDGRRELVAPTVAGGSILIAAGGSAGVFGAFQTVSVGANATVVLAHDLDRDGRIDLVAALEGNGVAVLRGTNGGGFAAPEPLSLPHVAHDLAIGDVDDDGVAEIVATGGGGTSTLRLTPAGLALLRTDSIPGERIYVADVDRDAVSDLIAVGEATGLLVHRGDLARRCMFGFAAIGSDPLLHSEEYQAADIIGSADVDRDGRPDVIHRHGGGLRVWHALGDGHFEDGPISAPVIPGARGAIGDLNGDGIPDVVLASSTAQNIGVYLGQPSLLFVEASQSYYGYGLGPFPIIGDVDLDGINDVIVAGSATKFYRGLGDGTLAPPVVSSSGADVTGGAQLIDVDLDGQPDLVTRGRYGFSQYVYGMQRNLGGGLFAPVSPLQGVGVLNAAQDLVDLDGDHVPDVLTWAGYSRGLGDGRFEAVVLPTVNGSPDTFVFAAPDVTGDGVFDLVRGGDYSAQTYVGLGGGQFAGPLYSPAWTGPSYLGGYWFDLNGDRRADAWSGGSVFALARDGGRLDMNVFLQDTLQWGDPNGVGDFDGDGWVDLVGAGRIRWSGPISGTTDVHAATLYEYVPMIVDDFNGDGISDYVSTRSGALTTVLGSAARSPIVVDASVTVPIATFPSLVGDFNRDGKLDLVAWTNADRVTARVLLGQGDGHFVPGATVSTGQVTQVRTADLNRDGRLDLVRFDSTQDRLSIWWGNGDGTFGVETQVAVGLTQSCGFVAGAPVQIGDVDVDGALDLVLLPGNAFGVCILRGDGGGGFATPVSSPVDDPTVPIGTATLVKHSNFAEPVLEVGTSTSRHQYILKIGERPRYIGQAPSDVWRVDLDRDGRQDLIAGHTSNYSLGFNWTPGR